jgi:hypothetical protein
MSHNLIFRTIYDIIFICGKKIKRNYVKFKNYADPMLRPLYVTSLNIPEKTSIKKLTFIPMKGKILI